MKLIDLHVHSTASDGSFTPAEVTALAREAGLTAIALTDHDTVSGVGEALAAAGDFPLEVVPGVELSCLYKEKEIHILGLYIDHTDKAFLDFLDQAEIKRNRMETKKLLPLTFEMKVSMIKKKKDPVEKSFV